MAGLAATYVDADTFTVSTDLTEYFIEGRRVKCNCGVDGFKYGTIESSSFAAGNTTVNLTSTSDNLTSNLTEAWYGIVGGGADNQSIPVHDHDDEEGEGGLLVFGSEFQQTSDDTESSTTSSTFQQKLRLTTPSLPSGTYRIGFYCEYWQSNVSDFCEVKIELNDTTVLATFIFEPEDNDDRWPGGGFVYQSLSGVNTIDMDWRQQGGGTAFIRRARLEIWRVT